MNNLFDKKNFQKNPISYIYSLSQSNLESIVKTLDDNYYNGSSIVSDNEYDLIIDFIKNNYPDSEILNKTGHVVNSTKKIKLPTFLGSMDKVKKIDSWVKKYPDEWIISDKLDGISLLLTNNKAFTRGNGIEGQDISWILYYIDNSKISTDMIRGELIVSKKNWEIIKAKYPDFSNPRNFVSGIISRKEQNKELISYLDFIGYEYITEEPILIEDQMIKIQEKGLKCVTYKKFTEISNESISKYLLKRRENGDYEIDGVIICHNKKKYKRPDGITRKNPEYAKAFKMILDEQNAETLVKSIVWTPSMYGVIKPVIHISEVTIEGVKINKVTGNNANFILHNTIGGKIGPGAKLLITRSGGVIPKVIKVITPYEHDDKNCLYNGDFVWNSTNVDIILTNPMDNDIVKKKRLEHFFKSINVNYMKEGIIDKLYKNGYNTIKLITGITFEDLKKIDGIQDKMALKLFNEINNKYKKCSFKSTMVGSGIFQGVGEKTFTTLLNHKPPKNLESMQDYLLSYQKKKNNEYIDFIISLDALGKENSKKIVNNLYNFKKFIYDIL